MMEIRREVRARRAALRMTQKTLAERVGVQGNTICKFEANRCGISVGVLEKICEVLGLRLKVEVMDGAPE